MSAATHPAPRYFNARGAELMVGDVPVSELASRFGTPFYAYSSAAIDARIGELRAILPGAIKLHYAIKANPMPDVVRFISPLVDGLDVASGRELSAALDAGMRPRDISFAGPGKSVAELEQAVSAGILLNVESFREIALLEAIQQRVGKPARVAVRVNPDFELKSSGMKMGGGPKQFGIDAEVVPQALQETAVRTLAFEGFHIFSGSQNLKAASICEALSKGLELAARLADAAPSPVKVLNLGGGFGIPYFPGELPLDLATIGTHLRGIAAQAEERLPGAELVIELGRFVVGEAGVYVCRVLERKVSRGEVFLVTDGGLHHHLAASGNFGQVIRKNYPVTVATRMDAQETECASVVGPLCTPLDLLGDKMSLARATEGDLIVVFQSGAYGLTASPQGFLSHPTPKEILI